MGETDNIARMASKVSDELLGVFGWRRTGPVNENWQCVTEAHAKTTHPSDVVFSYEDPYRDLTIFWTVDLKSYAAGTINKGVVRNACGSLVKAVECAGVCQGWHSKYVDVETNWRCDGLLFVYNHDGAYAGDFGEYIQDLDMSTLALPKGRRVVALGVSEFPCKLTSGGQTSFEKNVELNEHARPGDLAFPVYLGVADSEKK